MPPGRRLAFSLAEVNAVAKPFMRPDRVEKWITLDCLRWTQSAPDMQPRFVGVLDEQGALSSYLMLQEHEIKKRPAWLVVDWFTTTGDMNEVFAALGQICRRPGLLGEARRFIEVMTLGPSPEWLTAPALARIKQQPKLSFSFPAAMRDAERHSVLLDGDYGMCRI